MLSIGSTVDALFNGVWYVGTIEDYAGGEYSIRTDVWRQKKWFKLSEVRETGNKLPEKEVSKVVTKKQVQPENPKPVLSKGTDNANEGTQLVTVKTDKLYKVRLGQLITIGQTTIEDAKDAERPLDQTNLDSLIAEDDKNIPPIEIQRVVVKGQARWVIVDGKHRRARLVALAQEKYRKSIGKDKKDPDTDKYTQLLDTSEQTAMDKVVEDTTTFAKAVNAKDDFELLTWVWTANNKHGLQSSKQGRAKYALWLIKTAKRSGKVLSMRQAAKLAGTSHVNINHYLAAKKRQDEIVDPDTGKPVQKTAEQLEQAARSQADKDCRLLASVIKRVWSDMEDDTPEEATDYLSDFFKTSDIESLAGMISLLERVNETLLNKEIKEASDEDDEDDLDDEVEE